MEVMSRATLIDPNSYLFPLWTCKVSDICSRLDHNIFHVYLSLSAPSPIIYIDGSLQAEHGAAVVQGQPWVRDIAQRHARTLGDRIRALISHRSARLSAHSLSYSFLTPPLLLVGKITAEQREAVSNVNGHSNAVTRGKLLLLLLL